MLEIEASAQKVKDPSANVNLLYLNLYVLALGVGLLQLGFGIAGNNQTANIIAAKFEWSTEETQFYNSVINVCSVVGMGTGSIAGGLIIPIGRRKTLIIFNLFSMVALGITLIENVWAISVGKLLFGFSAGVISIAAPKMLDETVPAHLVGAFGIMTNFYIAFGILLNFLLGLGLPQDPLLYSQDQFWRISYGFPILLCVVQLVCCFGILKHDSILYLL